jgi:hypothetical protein
MGRSPPPDTETETRERKIREDSRHSVPPPPDPTRDGRDEPHPGYAEDQPSDRGEAQQPGAKPSPTRPPADGAPAGDEAEEKARKQRD